jgi:uncharacterized repeat protein (TIGR01451 family)
MSKKLRLAFALLVIASLVLTPLATVSAEEAMVKTSLDAYKDRFATSDLFALAQGGGSEEINVNLILTEDADVSKWMNSLVLRKAYGGIRGATGQIKAGALAKVATEPGVLSIRPFITEKPETMRPVPPDGARPKLERGPKGLPLRSGAPVEIASPAESAGAQAEPQSYYGVDDVMDAKAAWDMGYTGEGVIVGHLDDGCDFGHPDLEGTWATVMDETSPYYGWPLVYDPGPAFLYVLGYGAFGWEAAWDETLAGRYSYYVDTSATPEITITDGGLGATAVITTVGYADPPTYSTPAILSNVYSFSNTSKSGVYHAGIHPESYLSLLNTAGAYAAILVVDENEAGVYDTVYVDWDGNHVFDTDERFSKEYPTGWYYDEEMLKWSRDENSDGVADVSAGMLYWVSDGDSYIPGTEVLYYPEYLEAPSAGDLVLFYGDYNGNSHGTGTGSAVTAQGVITGTMSYDDVQIPTWADVSEGTVRGAAPGAKLFSSNLFNVGTTDLDSWIVHAVGYDGQQNTGDEAQLNTNSWGWIVREDAWLYDESRTLTRLSEVFPYMTWVISSGNGGYGYGTSGAPGTMPNAIQVGGYDLNGTTYYYNEPIAGPDQILWGDLTPFSSRGPDTAGRGDIEIMGIADGATGAMPVMHVPAEAGVIDGQMAFTEFGGTSQAAPFVAGVSALAAQAYKEANDMWPDYSKMHAIMMSSATDANNDPFVQGAGRVNATKAVEAAGAGGSFYVSPSRWDAGDYRGETYTDFSHLVEPGASTSQVFTVHNTGEMTKTLQISSTVLMRIGEWEKVLETSVEDEEETRNLSKPDYLVALKDGEVNHIPEDTDLMVVSAAIPWTQFSLGDHTVPASMTVDSLWYMKLLNWTDLNGNGVLWDDANENGAVNDGELDNPPSMGDVKFDNSSQELNEYNLSYQYATTKQCRVEKPLERSDDGLFVGMIHYTNPRRDIDKSKVPTTTLTIRAEFYKEMPVDWLSASTETLEVGAGMTETFTSTVTIPADQMPGLYQAKLQVSDGMDQKATIPVIANVPAMVENGNLNFDFGGDPSDNIFDNSTVYGGFDWLGNGALDQGDWRMFFVDVPDETGLTAGTQWFIDTKWESAYTDLDTLVFGPTEDSLSADYPEDFGPYALGILGGSQDTSYNRRAIFGWGSYAYAWQTNTGEAHETVASPVKPGLNMIAIQSVLYGNMAPYEHFTGTVGTISIEPWPITATSTTLTGTTTVSFTSSIDISGLGYGGSYGLSKPTIIEDAPITQGGQKLYRFSTQDSALLELTLGTKNPDTTPDLDLYLYRYIDGEWVEVASSATATSDEHIRIVKPTDGLYLAQVYGYSVTGTGTFDLTIRNIQGDDLSATDLPEGAIEAGETYTFTVAFDTMAASGTYEGLILMGTDKAPIMLQVPVEITFDTPDLSESMVMAPETATWGERLEYTIVAENQGAMTGTVMITDVLPQSDNVWLISDTLTASMGMPMWDSMANDGYGLITWEGTIGAGATLTMTFELETMAPQMGSFEVITNTVMIDAGINPPVTLEDQTAIKPYLRLQLPMVMK